jgi:prepilin signal peptidase PulO-like enzyme (type II secretory pathway)
MLLIFALAVAMFGLLIGSFLNVVAIRTLKQESIVFPPSHCVYCDHRLGVLDLIPVLSFLRLKGRCRYCKERISLIYPFGESLTALLYGVCAWHFGVNYELIPSSVFASILVMIIVTDIREMIIPNRIVYSGMIILVGIRLFIHPLPLINYGIAFIFGGGILLAISMIGTLILRKEGMGGGDLKLFALAGLVLGIKLILLSIFVSSLLGTLYGVGLMIMSRFERGKPIAFGPFIAAGSLISFLWGNEFIQWYLELVRL